MIELLVVIAIIGILASIVLASLNTARKKSRDARRIADVGQLRLALELYFDTAAGYPNALSLLTSGCGGSCIATVPTPPTGAGQAAYAYAGLGSGATCTSYHIGAVLEDSGNTALGTDSDATAGTACTGSAADFSGAGSTNCAGGAGTDVCYDVKN